MAHAGTCVVMNRLPFKCFPLFILYKKKSSRNVFDWGDSDFEFVFGEDRLYSVHAVLAEFFFSKSHAYQEMRPFLQHFEAFS